MAGPRMREAERAEKRQERYDGEFPADADIQLVGEAPRNPFKWIGSDCHPSEYRYYYATANSADGMERVRQSIYLRGYRRLPSDKHVHPQGLPQEGVYAEVWYIPRRLAEAHDRSRRRDQQAKMDMIHARKLRGQTESVRAGGELISPRGHAESR